MKKGIEQLFYAFVSASLLLIFWHIIHLIINSNLFPSPFMVFKSFLSIVSTPENFKHVLISFSRVFISLIIALFIGTFLGVLPEYNKFCKKFIEIILMPLFQSLPALVWAVLASVWFGVSYFSTIFILTAVLIPIFLINAYEGTKNLDRDLIELGNSFSGSKLKNIKHVILPMLFPYIFSGLRRGVGVAWKVVILAEFFAAQNGIGYLIHLHAQLYNISKVLALTFLILLIVVMIDYGLLKRLNHIFYFKGE